MSESSLQSTSATISTQKQFKKGDVRDDGSLFTGYSCRYRKDGTRVEVECWATPRSYLKHLFVHATSEAKRRARIAAVPCSITSDYIQSIFPEDSLCPALGVIMEFGGDRETSPSIDRIKPELGYVEGNVIWVSYRANRIKNDASIEELRRVADFYSTRH